MQWNTKAYGNQGTNKQADASNYGQLQKTMQQTEQDFTDVQQSGRGQHFPNIFTTLHL